MKKKQGAAHSVQRKPPIYEDIRWRFIIQLATLGLITLMITEIFLYDELTKNLAPEKLELGETILSMFIIFDLLLVIRYVPDKVEFLKKNWLKAMLVLPTWLVVKPFNLLGIDSVIPALFSQSGITQVGRGINVFDSIRDVLDKL